MAQRWSDIRKQAALAPEHVVEARKELDRQEHAYRLNEIRARCTCPRQRWPRSCTLLSTCE